MAELVKTVPAAESLTSTSMVTTVWRFLPRLPRSQTTWRLLSGPWHDPDVLEAETLALDTFGNLYFADETSDRIRRVDSLTGLIETVAGGGNSVPTELDPAGLGNGGAATEGRLRTPAGVWLDGQDNLLQSSRRA